MKSRIAFIFVLLVSFIPTSRSHVGQPCNRLIKVCLASHSYCDNNNICRCRPEYPVNISLHSCRQGKQYNERCDYTEECLYYDKNSYCSQLPYRSICECHAGYNYDEIKKVCEKVGSGTPKVTNYVFPTAIGLSLFFAIIVGCCLVTWHVCKRNRMNLHPRYTSTPCGSQRSVCVASAPSSDEALPTYDTALTLKSAEDCEPPPSYEEVIRLEETSSKT